MQDTNKFSIAVNTERPDHNVVTAILTPFSVGGPLMRVFERVFTLAILQAEREELSGGGLKLVFVLDAQECTHLRAALMATYLEHSQFYFPN